MIELPDAPGPNGAAPSLLDFGITLRPATGAEVLRVDRKGSRFRLEVSYPPMQPEVAELYVSRLLRAKSEGLRIPYPLLVDQGSPGSPVVDGASPSGTTLPLRGLTAGYAIKEGYWLSIEDENGRHYLHKAAAPGTADSEGEVEIAVTPALRWPFADGATVHLAAPMVEGFVDGEAWGWTIPVNGLIALQFPLEESA